MMFFLCSERVSLKTCDGLDHCITFVCHLYSRSSRAPVLLPAEGESKDRIVFPICSSAFLCLSVSNHHVSVRVFPLRCSSGDLLNPCLPSVARNNQMLLFAYLQFILLLLRQLSSVQLVYTEDKYR